MPHLEALVRPLVGKNRQFNVYFRPNFGERHKKSRFHNPDSLICFPHCNHKEVNTNIYSENENCEKKSILIFYLDSKIRKYCSQS